MNRKKTRILVECALMIAVSVVLSMIKVITLPQGGSVTAASAAPLILISYRHGPKWGLAAAFVRSLVEMVIGFYPPPAKTFLAFVLVILLDYIIAFTILGAAVLFGKPFNNRVVSVAVGSLCVTLIRYLCSFVSGMVVWQAYAPADMPVWLYSLTYNGSYMIPEMILTSIVAVLLVQVMDRTITPVHA